MIATYPRPIAPALALSPDEKEVLLSQLDAEGTDLMLVENLR